MIKNLSLSSTFPAWTWEHSNGTATDEQTTSSYQVLIDAGKCVDFSRLVWNDIIDVLQSIFDEVGIEWDATYCTAEEAKITQAYGVLTSYAWNSVSLNIKRFGFVSWKWARNSQTPGCIGRDKMNGYATHGEDADYLYAWYLLEMTEKLNRLIQVFKNEADFSDFSSDHHSSTAINARMSAPKIEAITASPISESFAKSPLAAVPVLQVNGDGKGYSYQNGILLPLETSRFHGWGKGASYVEANIKTLGIAGLYTDYRIESHTDAGIKVFGIAAMKNEIEAITKHIASAVSLGVASANSTLHEKSHYTAESVAHKVEVITHTSKSEFKVAAEAKALVMKLLETAPKAESKVDANLRADNPKFLESAEKSGSQTDARQNAIPSQILHAASKAESRISGLLSTKQSNPLRGYAKAVSAALAKPEPVAARCFKAAVQSVSKAVATLDFWKEVFEWIDPIQTGSNLYIQSVWSSWSEADKAYIDVAEFYAPVKDGSNLYIQSAYRAYSDGDKGYIDTDVYYEPVQTGSNLFITSAESIKGDFNNG